MKYASYLILSICAIGCGSPADQGGDAAAPDAASDTGSGSDAATGSDAGQDAALPGKDGGPTPSTVVFVIPMENRPQSAIYGNNADAPYINGTLMTAYAHTTNFNDELPSLMSEPHYVWMESGSNSFSDVTFASDADASKTNSTKETNHLTAQLNTAGISWTSYQEGIKSGTCPIGSSAPNFYAAKHNPFVFFQDISGNPPSATNPGCSAHHKAFSDLAGDLASSSVSTYNFITPNLCNDMHGDNACSHANTDSANIQAGDTWLKNNLPAIITYALAHAGFVFVTWDEGDSSNLISFIAVGKNSIAGRAGSVKYTHTSLLKSEEEILGVPVIPTATSATDLADLFTSFP